MLWAVFTAGSDLEEFEAGYQESLKRLAESKAEQEAAQSNIQTSLSTLESFVKENGLTEEQATGLHDTIFNAVEGLLMGIIPAEFISHVWKGMNHDKDVQEAAETGVAEGRNQTIDMKKKAVAASPLPDLGNNTGAGKMRPTPAPRRRRSFFDD